jgi:hypothetical protein
MDIYCTDLEGSQKIPLNKLLSYDLSIWQNYEEFTDYFEVFKQNILSKHKNKITISEYFIGCYYSKDTGDINLKLNQIINKVNSIHRFPNYSNFTNLINELFQWDDEIYLFKNASGMEWADSWKSFNKTVMLYQKKTEEISSEKTLSFTDIEIEIKKNNELIFKIKEFEENNFITCILTTKPISNECIKNITETKNLIVISRESFSIYYGEAFSLKLKYCKRLILKNLVSGNIYVNEMDENQLNKFSLNKTQKEIMKIRSNTPFQNWEHLTLLIPKYPKKFKDITFF